MAPVFRLYACCQAVKGACRSSICDLQRRRIHLIPTALYEILTDHRDRGREEILALYGEPHAATIEDYFRFLHDEELGFWCDEPEAFPPLDLTWERPEVIHNAIVDVDAASRHDFASIYAQLDDLGCKFLQLRLFCRWPLARLEEEALEPLSRGRLRGVDLILEHDPAWSLEELEEVCVRHPRVSSLFLHSAPDNRNTLLERCDVWVCERVDRLDGHSHCGRIHPGWFSPTLDCFLESQRFNTCLHRKVSVDVRGDVCNCPSLGRRFGNVRDTSLHAVVAQQGFRELWEINKDQIEVCKDCEFRHVCSDCRAFIERPDDLYSKPSKCSYDPYTATWGDAAAADSGVGS